MASSGLTPSQWAPWVGIIVSLGWNLYNSWKSNAEASRIRHQIYRSSEWARIRAGILECAHGFVDTAYTLNVQAKNIKTAQINNEAVAACNEAMAHVHDQLCIALREATCSEFCEDDDWEQVANGDSVAGESSWDRILVKLNEAQAADDIVEKQSAFATSHSLAKEIRNAVLERCMRQDRECAPEPPSRGWLARVFRTN